MKLVLFMMSLLAAESLAMRCYCINHGSKHNTITDNACPTHVKLDHNGFFYCEWDGSERSWIERCQEEDSGSTGDCI
ncbi:hypothetical protein CGRA01v4_04404 [Colletotrichum graminicola]|nr:hypothetical protein CGRA01v4_04404 [Colletotrichum graminicola]